ncbi:MAG: Xaa-Pro aminopeptidase [Candidatus Methanohalarchaeum thermophilum]|uniref:Xaa-Pro aminopeptidase n=1 Tax=Methanohalarchaeum thermophilum TaxID=1903181 RepID=A0A1Q6DVB3_METT1|nr:MAG: Xaa-Pro aminopeptidase [Candidatus Methanohalarchaeum thermophilum]
MKKRIKKLKNTLREKNCDAFLMYDGSYINSTLYYFSSFLRNDPFIFFLNQEGEPFIVVPEMEFERAKKESRVQVKSLAEYIDPGEEKRNLKAIKEIIKDSSTESIGVPNDFNLSTAEYLSNETELKTIDLSEIRTIKSKQEIEKIQKAQKSAEAGMKAARNKLEKTEVVNGELYLNGEPVTSEDIRYEIETELLKRNCEAYDIIVSSGKESADPHSSGTGVLSAGPIVIDIFPRLKQERYYGDLTRSYCITKNEEVNKLHKTVLEAQEKALNNLKAGVTGEEIHNLVCSHFEKKGYGTLRKGDKEGFIHSTGHGVGLDVHEHPYLSENGDKLRPGQVVTVEPGLYLNDIGGVRLEDLVLIKENGIRNLTSIEKDLYL